MMRACLLAAVLVAAGCASESETDVTVAPQPALGQAPAPSVDGETEGEAFATFFERFQNDMAFQRERVADDYMLRYLDPDAGEMVATDEPYEPSTLGWSGGESVRETFNGHSTPSAVPAADGAVEYQISGTDNGVNVSYLFARRDGLWYLVGIDDASM
ncbi:MAG: hypothetical protein ACK41D_06615 [Rubricoccaceae bacterium]